MTRITPVDPADAPRPVAETLATLRARLGGLPNLLTTLARSPAALDTWVAASGALAGGRLSPRERELVALAIAEANACDYCLAAHTRMARGAGVSAEEAQAARTGRAAAPREHALVALARRVVEARGRIDDGDLVHARAGGLDDGLIVELVAHVALNVLTNYVNHVAGTEIDFPEVAPAA